MSTTYLEEMMPFKIVGNWEIQSKKLQARYPQLTDDDLHFQEGGELELLFKMQTKLKFKLEEVIAIVKQGMPDKD